MIHCRTQLAPFPRLDQQIQGLREEIEAMARQVEIINYAEVSAQFA